MFDTGFIATRYRMRWDKRDARVRWKIVRLMQRRSCVRKTRFHTTNVRNEKTATGKFVRSAKSPEFVERADICFNGSAKDNLRRAGSVVRQSQGVAPIRRIRVDRAQLERARKLRLATPETDYSSADTRALRRKSQRAAKQADADHYRL